MVTKLMPTKPIATAFGFLADDGITFNTLAKEVSLHGCGVDVVRVVRWCNGQRDMVEVQALSGLSAERFAEVIEVLVQHDILIDSREYGSFFNEVAMFPPIVSYNMGPGAIRQLHEQSAILRGNESGIALTGAKGKVADLSRVRQSVRAFKSVSIHEGVFAGLLQVMYGRNDSRAVPSAGGLYTLQLHVLLMREVGDLSVGCYKYNPISHSLTKTKKMPTQDEVSIL